MLLYVDSDDEGEEESATEQGSLEIFTTHDDCSQGVESFREVPFIKEKPQGRTAGKHKRQLTSKTVRIKPSDARGSNRSSLLTSIQLTSKDVVHLLNEYERELGQDALEEVRSHPTQQYGQSSEPVFLCEQIDCTPVPTNMISSSSLVERRSLAEATVQTEEYGPSFLSEEPPTMSKLALSQQSEHAEVLTAKGGKRRRRKAGDPGNMSPITSGKTSRIETITEDYESQELEDQLSHGKHSENAATEVHAARHSNEVDAIVEQQQENEQEYTIAVTEAPVDTGNDRQDRDYAELGESCPLEEDVALAKSQQAVTERDNTDQMDPDQVDTDKMDPDQDGRDKVDPDRVDQEQVYQEQHQVKQESSEEYSSDKIEDVPLSGESTNRKEEVEDIPEMAEPRPSEPQRTATNQGMSEIPLSQDEPITEAPVSQEEPISEAPVSQQEPISEMPNSQQEPFSEKLDSQQEVLQELPNIQQEPLSEIPNSQQEPLSEAPLFEEEPVSDAVLSENHTPTGQSRQAQDREESATKNFCAQLAHSSDLVPQESALCQVQSEGLASPHQLEEALIVTKEDCRPSSMSQPSNSVAATVAQAGESEMQEKVAEAPQQSPSCRNLQHSVDELTVKAQDQVNGVTPTSQADQTKRAFMSTEFEKTFSGEAEKEEAPQQAEGKQTPPLPSVRRAPSDPIDLKVLQPEAMQAQTRPATQVLIDISKVQPGAAVDCAAKQGQPSQTSLQIIADEPQLGVNEHPSATRQSPSEEIEDEVDDVNPSVPYQNPNQKSKTERAEEEISNPVIGTPSEEQRQRSQSQSKHRDVLAASPKVQQSALQPNQQTPLMQPQHIASMPVVPNFAYSGTAVYLQPFPSGAQWSEGIFPSGPPHVQFVAAAPMGYAIGAQPVMGPNGLAPGINTAHQDAPQTNDPAVGSRHQFVAISRNGFVQDAQQRLHQYSPPKISLGPTDIKIPTDAFSPLTRPRKLSRPKSGSTASRKKLNLSAPRPSGKVTVTPVNNSTQIFVKTNGEAHTTKVTRVRPTTATANLRLLQKAQAQASRTRETFLDQTTNTASKADSWLSPRCSRERCRSLLKQQLLLKQQAAKRRSSQLDSTLLGVKHSKRPTTAAHGRNEPLSMTQSDRHGDMAKAYKSSASQISKLNDTPRRSSYRKLKMLPWCQDERDEIVHTEYIHLLASMDRESRSRATKHAIAAASTLLRAKRTKKKTDASSATGDLGGGTTSSEGKRKVIWHH